MRAQICPPKACNIIYTPWYTNPWFDFNTVISDNACKTVPVPDNIDNIQ